MSMSALGRRSSGHWVERTWSCTGLGLSGSMLYQQEYSQRLNPLAEPLRRSRRSRQSIGRARSYLPGLGGGLWRRCISWNGISSGLRVAAERIVGAQSLEHDRHVERRHDARLCRRMGPRCRDSSSTRWISTRIIPGWVHYVLATNHYRKGEFEKALVQAKRSTMTQVVWTPLCVAVAAGQLGLAADARAAIDVIRDTPSGVSRCSRGAGILVDVAVGCRPCRPTPGRVRQSHHAGCLEPRLTLGHSSSSDGGRLPCRPLHDAHELRGHVAHLVPVGHLVVAAGVGGIRPPSRQSGASRTASTGRIACRPAGRRRTPPARPSTRDARGTPTPFCARCRLRRAAWSRIDRLTDRNIEGRAFSSTRWRLTKASASG